MAGRSVGSPLAAFRVPNFLPLWLSNLLQFLSAQRMRGRVPLRQL